MGLPLAVDFGADDADEPLDDPDELLELEPHAASTRAAAVITTAAQV
jgi:hypothetical protein